MARLFRVVHVAAVVFIMLLAACEGGKMEDISGDWRQIVESGSASEEAVNIGKFLASVRENDIHYTVNVKDTEGGAVAVGDLADFDSAILVNIAWPGSDAPPVWKPLDKENVFLLFRE